MSPQVAMWLVGIGATVAVATLGGIVTLIVYALKLGAAAGQVREAVDTIKTKLGAIDAIPKLETRVGMVENTLARMVSDVSELRETNGEFRGRLDSITEDT